jgi:hypothetical protein
MADNEVCGNCGASIPGESASGGRRNPCPQCGSLARGVDLQASIGAGAEVGAELTRIPYPERLLTVAQDLIAREEFSIAAVVAQMACEISVERALSRAFTTKGIEYLEASVKALFSGYSLSNERFRDLFNAMTDQRIQDQPIWADFRKAARLRNDVIHRGKIANKREAEDAVKAARDLVAYLK